MSTKPVWTVDALLRSREVGAEGKLIVLWLMARPHRAYHRDEVTVALGLNNFDLERSVRRLQHPDVALCEGTDPCVVEMAADNPIRGVVEAAPKRTNNSRINA